MVSDIWQYVNTPMFSIFQDLPSIVKLSPSNDVSWGRVLVFPSSPVTHIFSENSHSIRALEL